jgi:hypothetical protein
LENTKVSPSCRVTNIIYKKTKDITTIQKIELKYIIPCKHLICQKNNYKYIAGKKCNDVKYFKYTINPRKYHIFITPSPNNKKSGFFDEIVQQYKLEKQIDK